MAYDIITLTANDGEEIDFYQIAEVKYRGKLYALLQPCELLEGMSDDEALVFGITRSGGNNTYHIEMNDKTIDGVFKYYNRQIKRQNGGGKHLKSSSGMNGVFGKTKALVKTTFSIVKLIYSLAFTLLGIAMIVTGLLVREQIDLGTTIALGVIGLILLALGVRGIIKFKNRNK